MKYFNPIKLKNKLLLFSSLLPITLFSQSLSFPYQENLIKNGNFELAYSNFYSNYKKAGNTIGPGEFAIVDDPSQYNPFFRIIKDSALGTGQLLVVDADFEEGKKFWCTKVKVSPNSEYQFFISAANIHLSSMKPPEILLTINDSEIGYTKPVTDSIWNQFNWEWQSGNINDSVLICLENINSTTEGNDLAVDDIHFFKIKAPCPYINDTLKSLVHFPFNESTLTNYSKEKISTLIKILTECPDAKVKILAHTDPNGSNSFNQKLSEERAATITRQLLLEGISENRIYAAGFGESRLLYSGNSFRNQIVNRRIDFIIY